MRKCSCGTPVRPTDLNAVVHKDKSGKVVKVTCGECASNTWPKVFKSAADNGRRKGWRRRGARLFDDWDEE